MSAAWTSALPSPAKRGCAIARIGDARPSSWNPSANYRFVGPEYFRTLSMPITKGRSLDEGDRNRAVTPAVVSARAAQTLWPGDDPIGRQFTRGDPTDHFEVVGVVVDGHPTALEAESPLMVYVPYWFNNEGKSVLVVRTPAEATVVASELRRVIHAVDSEIAIADATPLSRVVDKALGSRHYQMWLFTAFGAVALLIATVGVYATTAYGVSRRRREMNIRVALGARASQVFTLVLRQSAMPLLAGIAVGCGGAPRLGWWWRASVPGAGERSAGDRERRGARRRGRRARFGDGRASGFAHQSGRGAARGSSVPNSSRSASWLDQPADRPSCDAS